MSLVRRFHRKLSGFEIQIENWSLLDQGFHALWGPSGSGKSTIIHGLLGFDPKAKVEWCFGDEDISLRPPSQRQLGVVLQEPSLFPHLSVKENLLFPVDVKKHEHWQMDYDFLVTAMELGALTEQKAHILSGGEQRRVALARAVIYRPRMLLLDEPFSSLDQKVRRKTRAMLKEVQQRLKIPVLFVTHEAEDVEDLASRVSILEKGKILREGDRNLINC